MSPGGPSTRDVYKRQMQYTSKDHRFAIYTKQGIYFIGKNRNSPMYEIHVTPARDSFMPMCRD